MYEKIGNLFDEVKVLIDENVDDKEDREEIYDRLYEIEELNKEIIFASREFIDEVKFGWGVGKVERKGMRLKNLLIDCGED